MEVTLDGAHVMAGHGAEVFTGALDAADLKEQCGLAEIGLLKDGGVVQVGQQSCTVVHTPGHTPGLTEHGLCACAIGRATPPDPRRPVGICGLAAGSVCYQFGDCLFTGDTLFVGSCGRVDLPGSDPAQMHGSLRRLASLSEDMTVLPGHK